MSAGREPGDARDLGAIASLLILGASLIGLGNILRHLDDNLADLGD